MNIKVQTWIYIETDDPEYACITLDQGLEQQLAGYTSGKILGVNVDHYETVKQAELEEKGFVE